MKAAIRKKYNSPDGLKVEVIEKPKPRDDEVLIRVCAVTVNRTDCGILTGKPFIMRFFTGLLKPKLSTLGTDFSGKIEAVGIKVRSFKMNDEVWGFYDEGLGSQSEYMCFSEKRTIAMKPKNTSYEEAVASLEAVHYAYNFIKKVNLKSGQKILVNGATGAIGSALVQILKYHNVYVTAVCNTKNTELIKSLGADRIIDYNKEDFTKDNEKYDVIFDAVGKSTFTKCKPLLQRKGVYISSEFGPMAQNLFLAVITPLFARRRVIFPFPRDIRGSMAFIKELIEKGKFKPVIERRYQLEDIAEAYKYVLTGQKTGNVVINMGIL